MQSQRVTQTHFRKSLKSGALAVRAHDRAAPKLWIVNIDIFRRNIEIAADDQIDLFLFDQAIAQSHVPFQFIFVGRRGNGLAVRRVNRVDAQISNRRRNYASLRIDNFIAKRRANFGQFAF